MQMGAIVCQVFVVSNSKLHTFTCQIMKVNSAQTPANNSHLPMGQVSGMDIRLLQIFATVVACGGMSAAALELNIGTSTLSRHIKDLETRLGLVLCRRGRAGFALSPEGQRVHEQTLRLLAAVDGFRIGLHDIHERLGGTLSLALFDKTASNPRSNIAQALAAFRAQAPDVHVHVHVGTITEIERGVAEGRYQVGIVPAHREAPGMQYQPLFDETMHLYCAPGHPLFTQPHLQLGWDELRGVAFAGLGYNSPNMDLTHQKQLLRQATGYDQEAIATLILSGCYVGFLPEHYAQSFVTQGRMRALHPETLRYDCQFSALWRTSPQANRVTERFVACLQGHRLNQL
jgi:LysR family transcriptional regulator, transcriptional activator for bauABCD operon